LEALCLPENGSSVQLCDEYCDVCGCLKAVSWSGHNALKHVEVTSV